MSETVEETREDGSASAKRKPLLLVLVLVTSLVVGGGVGVFVAVPLLLGNPAATADVSGAAADSLAEPPARAARANRDGPPILFTVENMVLNPKGTGGTRFLMVTTAFEVGEARTVEQMRVREHEVRDLLLHTFGQKSVEELADLGQRESLREDVRVAVESLLHPGAIVRVYLPQFVIQ